jgi:hypothetical protein
MKKLTTVLFVLMLSYLAEAQNSQLFEFPSFKNAVMKERRTRTGVPGPKYWQNSSDYILEATIDTSKNLLLGKGSVIYHNNCPFPVYYIVLRFYQDVYKKGASRNSEVSPEDLHDGTVVDSLLIDGVKYMHNGEPFGSNQIYTTLTTKFIILRDSIPPGGTAKLEYAWNFHIPTSSTTRRMGRYSDNFFIALWYPQIAVFDDIKFYDTSPHLGSQEFYNDFNNYDVTIHVPEGYMVWATGECENLSQVVDKKVIEKMQFAASHDSIVSILTSEDFKDHPVIGNKWHFTAEHVPDFAFAAATDYFWKGTSVEVDPQTKRRVFVDIIYPEDSVKYTGEISTAKNCIAWASLKFPGVPFPYSHASTFFNGFENSGSMEFPMIVNDMIYTYMPGLTTEVVAHELLHNYTPFYMGFDETSYGWMDEGWAHFMDKKFMGGNPPLVNVALSQYPYLAGRSSDFPLIYSTLEADPTNYDFHSYYKPAFNLQLLEELLGEEAFLKATQEFMMTWNGKHPTPYDFFYSFNTSTGIDLNWFWKACYFDFGYSDLAIKSVEKNKITIENKGHFPVPVNLEITYADSSQEKIYRNPGIWQSGATEYQVKLNTKKAIKNIILGGDSGTPDADPSDNVYPR